MQPEQLAGLAGQAPDPARQRVLAHAVEGAEHHRLAAVAHRLVARLGRVRRGQAGLLGEGQVDVARPVRLEQGRVARERGRDAHLLRAEVHVGQRGPGLGPDQAPDPRRRPEDEPGVARLVAAGPAAEGREQAAVAAVGPDREGVEPQLAERVAELAAAAAARATTWPGRGRCRRPAPAPRSAAAARGCPALEEGREPGRLEREAVVHAVLGVDLGDQRRLDPVPAGPQPLERGRVDRDAVPLHAGRGGHVAAPQQRLAERLGGVPPAGEDLRQHRRQEPRQRVHVGRAVGEQRATLLGACTARPAWRGPASPSSRRPPCRRGRATPSRPAGPSRTGPGGRSWRPGTRRTGRGRAPASASRGRGSSPARRWRSRRRTGPARRAGTAAGRARAGRATAAAPARCAARAPPCTCGSGRSPSGARNSKSRHHTSR